MEPKTFEYATGKVTVHGWENWPQERFAPILAEYMKRIEMSKEVKKDALCKSA